MFKAEPIGFTEKEQTVSSPATGHRSQLASITKGLRPGSASSDAQIGGSGSVAGWSCEVSRRQVEMIFAGDFEPGRDRWSASLFCRGSSLNSCIDLMGALYCFSNPRSDGRSALAGSSADTLFAVALVDRVQHLGRLARHQGTLG